MKKLMMTGAVAAGVAFLAGVSSSCTEGSALRMSSQSYAPVPVEKVRVSAKYPAKYESIGLVEASAEHWLKSDDGKAQLALGELKAQAAKMGANMVVVKSFSADQSSGGMILDSDGDLGVLLGDSGRRRVSGEAIRVR